IRWRSWFGGRAGIALLWRSCNVQMQEGSDAQGRKSGLGGTLRRCCQSRSFRVRSLRSRTPNDTWEEINMRVLQPAEWSKPRGFPPSTLLYIDGLVDVRAKVEIEVTAFVSQS